MKRARASLLAAAVLLFSRPAPAEDGTGFAVARFEPAERGSAAFVADTLDLASRLRPAVGATFDYAYKPLAVYDPTGRERAALVRHQALVHAGASLVFGERYRVAIDLPLAILQDGDDVVVSGRTLFAATSAAPGDLRLAADVRVAGRHDGPATLAVGARLWLPTGSRTEFTSDGSVRVAPQVLAAGRAGLFAWAARLAIVLRPRDDAYAGSRLGSELLGAAFAGARTGNLTVGPELTASTVITSDAFLKTRGTPVEAMFGLHYDIASLVRVGAGIGRGLTRGYGSPAFRALLSIDWLGPAGPSDRDGDRVLDQGDACPDVAGAVDPDPEQNGCPARESPWGSESLLPRSQRPAPPPPPPALAVVTDTEIKIAEQVRFAVGSAELLPESDAVLSAVQRLLEAHREIKKVRVEGHTDDTGDPAFNEELSSKRAESVLRWLTSHGVEASRLTSEGFGARRPAGSNATEEGRANNRRVVFTILERADRD